MEKNLLPQTIWPLLPPIRVLPRLRTHSRTTAALLGKKWYYGTNLQATCFLVSYLKVTSIIKWKHLKMCHLRHNLRIFLFLKKVMIHSRDSQVFVFLTIPWFSKSVTSWWVLVHETGCIFEYIFWTTSH